MTNYVALMVQRKMIIANHMDDVVFVPTTFNSIHNGVAREKTVWQWWVGSEDAPTPFEGAAKFFTADDVFATKKGAERAYKKWRAEQ